MSAMLAKCLLALMVITPMYAQSAAVFVAGVELRLGMAKDSVLAKYAALPSAKLNPLGDDGNWFMVMVKQRDVWDTAGSVTFQSGKLSRIAIEEDSTNNKDAATVIKGFYNSISSAEDEKAGLVGVFTATNGNAKTPIYEVHLVFKDREVVIQTGSSPEAQVTSVKTYYPRVRSSESR